MREATVVVVRVQRGAQKVRGNQREGASHYKVD